MTINSVAQEISDTGYGSPGLRDEVYIQLCKQVSDNPRRESLRRGWELLGERRDERERTKCVHLCGIYWGLFYY